MNPKIQPLIDRVSVALAKPPPLGGVVNVDFGDPDGQALIEGSTFPACVSYNPPGFKVTADCTITFEGVAGLEKLEAASGFMQAMMLADGEVDVEGDRSLAEKLVGILQSAT